MVDVQSIHLDNNTNWEFIKAPVMCYLLSVSALGNAGRADGLRKARETSCRRQLEQ